MEQHERTLRRERAGPGAAEENGGGGSSGDLLRQAQGWAAVAREAWESLEKGAEAEEALRRRRNSGGE